MNDKTERRQMCRVISAYQSSCHDPLVVGVGEALSITERETEWSGWLWCTDLRGKSSWVPEAYVTRRGEGAIANRDYDATELSVVVGEELTVHKTESGWLWCTNARGESGWVPADHVQQRP